MAGLSLRIAKTREALGSGPFFASAYSSGALIRHIRYPDDVLTPDVVDWSLLIVVVVIGVVSVAAMIAPMIGHRVSDCRAPDAAHDRADRTADNSSGDSAPDTSGDRAAFVSKGKLR
jgi:hypothetical protein